MEDQQPQTNGEVIINTNYGELEVELWSKETPKTCRNFIQLCLENYYQNCKLFRLIPGFMVQTGDPTNTGKGGQSVYDKPFNDEFNQKLKFNHRGILGMANNGKNSNGSQFFITFDKCNYLDYKHSVFGKIVGNTIFNLLEIQKVETDGCDRPIQDIYIIETRVVVNPFNDVLVRNQIIEHKQPKQTRIKKMVKNTNLLSFDDDLSCQVHKMVSSHDVLKDKKLSKNSYIHNKQQQLINHKKQSLDQIKKQIKMNGNTHQDIIEKKKQEIQKQHQQNKNLEISEENKKLLEGVRKRLNKRSGQYEIYQSSEEKEQNYSTDSDQYKNEEEKEIRQKQKDEYENLKIEYLQFKKTKMGSQSKQYLESKSQEMRLLSNLEKQRLKYIDMSKQKKHDKNIIEKLDQFRQKLNSNEVKQSDDNWMNNRLKFHIDSANAYNLIDNKQQVEKKTIDLKRQTHNYKSTVQIEWIKSRFRQIDGNVRNNSVIIQNIMKQRRLINQQQRQFSEQNTKKVEQHEQTNHQQQRVNDKSIQRNMHVLTRMRTYSAINTGIIAGIFGLSGLNGLVLYIVLFFITSLVLVIRFKLDIKRYFLNSLDLLLGGIGNDLLLYLMIWVIFHNLVNVL